MNRQLERITFTQHLLQQEVGEDENGPGAGLELARQALTEHPRLKGSGDERVSGLPDRSLLQALERLVARHGVGPSALTDAEVDDLDGVDPVLREPLAEVVTAFLGVEEATDQAYAHVDTPGTHPGPVQRLSSFQESTSTERRAEAIARAVDWSRMAQAQARLLQAVDRLAKAAAQTPTPAEAPATVNLCPALALDLAGTDNHYTTDCALVVDLGGDDTYHNNAGGSNLADGSCSLLDPPPRQYASAALVDLGQGDDAYGDPDAPRSCGANGGGFDGVGLLYDAGGDDVYTAQDSGTNGGGALGMGTLIDAGGEDRYDTGRSAANGGGGVAGFGLLVDVSGDDEYRARSDGSNGGADLAASGLLYDGGGNDTVKATGRGANGAGSLGGEGLLVNDGGDDVYPATQQGANGGGKDGLGLLVDTGGNDTYRAFHSGTNGGGSGGVGTLVDVAGDDSYRGDGFGSNGGGNLGVGLLLDGGGRDTYRGPGLRGGFCRDCTDLPKGVIGAQVDGDEAPGDPVREACREHPRHPPIRVSEDEGPQGFVVNATGEPRFRPGSGVTEGSGTAEDPYVIEDWCVPTTPSLFVPDPVPGVLVEDTRAHVVLRNLSVVGSGGFNGHGVWLRNVTNVTVEDSQIVRTHDGIRVNDAHLVEIRGNDVVRGGGDGVLTQDSGHVRIEENVLFRNSLSGVFVDRGKDTLVANNTALRNNDGIISRDAQAVRVTNNTVDRNEDLGILVVRTEDVRVDHNRVRGNDRHGISQFGGGEASIGNNTVVNTTNEGIYVEGVVSSTVVDNRVEGNQRGVAVKGDVGDVTVRRNNLLENRAGIGVDARSADETVDARKNWWGCSEGPGDPACQDARGDVLVDPWLTEPNPVAGAS